MGLTSLEDTIKEQLKERKNAHYMLVEGMSKLLTEKVKRFQSLDFQVSGLNWRLLIRPAVGVKGYLGLFVWIMDEKCTGPNWEVKFKYKISVVSETRAEHCYSLEGCHNEKKNLQGVDKFISYRAMKDDYLVNDKAVFYAEISNVQPNFPVTGVPRNMGTAERFKLIEFPPGKSKFTWTITEFSSFSGEEHSSYDFTAGPRRWRLIMCPKGIGEGKGNSLSLFLNAADHVTKGSTGSTLAVYKLRVLDQFHRNHYETTCEDWFVYDPDHPMKSSNGRPKFLPLEELRKDSTRGFLVNDRIYLGVEILIVSTTEYL